jgi:hypothetical protein
MAVLIALMKQLPVRTLLRMFVLAVPIAAVLGALGVASNPAVRFALALAVEIVFLLVLIRGVIGTTQAVVRSRRVRERRRLAVQHGWRLEARDRELPAALGCIERDVVADRSGHLVHVIQRPPEAALAHAIVRGEAHGVAFTAFDFFMPGAIPLEVVTAWMVELPHALPRLLSAEGLCMGDSDGDAVLREALQNGATTRGEVLATIARPDYARAVLTPEVVNATGHAFSAWSVNGKVLAATTPSNMRTDRRYGATPEQLAYGIEVINWLARVLSSPQIATHAI